MNTTKNQYGSVVKKDGGKSYIVFFWNPIEQQREYLGKYSNYEEANDVLNERNFFFFSENSWLLPKCISLDRKAKKFKFCVTIRNKVIHHSMSKSLEDIVDIKHKFINSLIL